jgi:hypothetical protein
LTPKPKKPAKRPLLLSRQLWVAVSFLVILAVVTAIRIRLLNMPLERDEGEYAYGGQLILQGVPPYQAVYSMKWPGIFAAYALIMGTFGQTPVGIHVGLILVTLASAGFVFLLTRRICGDLAAVVAGGTYALLSISPATLGLAAHATHFVMLFALGGIVLLQKLDDQTPPARVFFAGLLLGLAVLMKQSGVAFGLFGVAWIVWCEFSPKSRDWRRLAIRLGCLSLGGLLPIILTCLILVLTGVFDRFWLWTVQYARAYVSITTSTQEAKHLFNTVAMLLNAAPGLWGLASLGLFLLFCERSLRRWWFFVLGFAFFSFLAVCPGGYFRHHYFLQLVPAAGLLAGVAVHVASRLFARRQTFPPPAMTMIPAICFAVAMLWSLSKSSAIFFQLTPVQACRAIYGSNPFPESVEVGRYLAAHCPPDARIAVIGSEPEIYFYSHRRSATGYIYTYPLMEPQPYAVDMQQEMIREIEQANPDYVVFLHVSSSWGRLPGSSRLIFDWFGRYQQERLQSVGLVEILSSDQTEYRWFSSQELVVPLRTDYWLAILKNRFPSNNPPQKVK